MSVDIEARDRVGSALTWLRQLRHGISFAERLHREGWLATGTCVRGDNAAAAFGVE